MTTYYLWVFLFVIGIYLVYTDFNIARFIDLTFRLIKFQYEKIKWWIWINPKTPWAKYMIWRNSLKIAKELQKELSNKK